MATYYWVGGAGTWNASSTTNWASSSGGAGGAGVPTSADNVIFDTNSGTGSITCSSGVCNNLTLTATQALNLAGTVFSVYGNLSFGAGWTGSCTTGTATMVSDTAKTITTNGKSIPALLLTFVSVGGGSWTLQDALTTTNSIRLAAGTFNTNNFNLSTGAIVHNSNNSCTYNFGSSTITLTSSTPITNSSTIFTLNAGTSTINCTNAGSVTFNGYGLTYYNVNFTGGGTTTIAVQSANTFNNLSVTATTSGTKNITFAANQTINGSLTTSGTTTANRIQFGSSVAGTQRTLSVATMGTLTNTNFKDIALTGAASPWTAPLGVWNFGNNSGITFDTTTLYWVGGTGTWTNATNWSLSSGGAGSAGVPGPNNSIVIDASSGTGTISTNGGYCNNFTSTASQAIVLGGSDYLYVYGNLSLPSGGSSGYNASLQVISMSATTTGKTITTNGKQLYSLVLNGVGGEWTLQDALNSQFLTLTNGTFTTNNFNVTSLGFASNNSNVRTLNLGSSTFSTTGVQGWDITTSTNMTLNAGTSTVAISSMYTAAFGNFTYNNVTLTTDSVSGTGGVIVSGTATFNNFTITSPSNAGVTQYTISNSFTVNGTFTVTGGTANKRVSLFCSLSSTTRTITAAAVSLTDVDFYRIVGAGTATWTGTRLGDGGGNSNITFATPKTVYWNQAAGGNWVDVAWATSSGGAVNVANTPLAQDTAIIENTGLNTSATLSLNQPQWFYPNIDFSTRSNAVTVGMTVSFPYDPYYCGNVTYSSAVTFSGSTSVVFIKSSTVTLSGLTFPAPITVYQNGSLATSGAFTSSSTLTNNGTLTLGANATFVACTLGAASTTNFSTNKIIVTGSVGAVFTGNNTQIVTGTPIVEATYSGANTIAFTANTPSEANTISAYVSSTTGPINISGSFRDVDFTGSSGTLSNQNRTIYGNLTISSGMTLTGGVNTTTFAATSGTKTITTNGKTLDFPITFNGVGGTWQLADNLTQGSTRATTLTNGTLDLNGKTYTVGSFATAAGTKNLTFNGGTLTVPAVTTTAFNNAQPTNFTTTAGTGTGKISMTGATAKTFVGGGSTYNCTLEQAGAGALTVTGSNTFNDITNTTQPVSVLFTAGTTNTFNNFSLSGTSGNLVTIGSVTAASHTLSKASGIVDVSYCSISRSTATGGAEWRAYTINGNVNGGNNSGWLFAPLAGGLFFGSNF